MVGRLGSDVSGIRRLDSNTAGGGVDECMDAASITGGIGGGIAGDGNGGGE